MANILESQILSEGQRNLVIKITGVVDTNDIQQHNFISLNSIKSNDERSTLVGLRVDEITYSISSEMEAHLEWDSDNPQQIALLAGFGEFCAEEMGGLLPDRNRSGYSGGINLHTYGYVPGSVSGFTIILELVKLYA